MPRKNKTKNKRQLRRDLRALNDVSHAVLNHEESVIREKQNQILALQNEIKEIKKNARYEIKSLKRQEKNLRLENKQNTTRYWLINDPDNRNAVDEEVIRNRVKEKNFNPKSIGTSRFPIYEYDDIRKILRNIYNRARTRFTINIKFGVIWERNRNDGYGYYYFPGFSNYMFTAQVQKEVRRLNPNTRRYESVMEWVSEERPRTINNLQDLLNLEPELSTENIIDKIENPDSSSRLICVFAMFVNISRLDQPIGCSELELPDFIKKSRYINSVTGEGNLCFFKCIAIASGARSDRCITCAKGLFTKFHGHNDYNSYEGITERDIDLYEDFDGRYAINIINYYGDSKCYLIRNSKYNIDEKRTKIYLNLYRKHYSYVTDLAKLIKDYTCKQCNKSFRDHFNLERHEQDCNLKTKLVFPDKSRVFYKSQNLVRKLCDDYSLDPSMYKYDYLIVFDYEAYNFISENSLMWDNETMKRIKNIKYHYTFEDTKSTYYLGEQRPLSFSISTNTPGFKTLTLINTKEPHILVKEMFKYMIAVQEVASKLMKEKLSPLLRKNLNPRELNKLMTYIEQIPVIGFNSGGYDINILKTNAFIHEILKLDKSPNNIKTGTKYKAIMTKQFRFLDQMLYCSPGTSLKSFMEAYNKDDKDQKFPFHLYSFLTIDENKLNFKLDEFTVANVFNPNIADKSPSNIRRVKELGRRLKEMKMLWKNNNIETVKDLIDRCYTDDIKLFDECVLNLAKRLWHETTLDGKLSYRLDDIQVYHTYDLIKGGQLTQEQLDDCKKLWKNYNLISVRDLLIKYNEQDVEPFIKACLNYKEYFYKFNIDMYKDAVTLSGLASIILNRFSVKDEDIEEQTEIPPLIKTVPIRISNERINNYLCNDVNKRVEHFKNIIKRELTKIEIDEIKNEMSRYRLSESEILRLIAKFNYRCYYCHVQIDNKNWSLDRIDNDGYHTIRNCILSCVDCNRERSSIRYNVYLKDKVMQRYNKPTLWLIDKENKDVYFAMKDNIQGGPSIVVHRYHEANKTQIQRCHYDIKNNKWYHDNYGKTVKKIIGYDCNALYPHTMTNDQLCGKLSIDTMFDKPYDKNMIKDICNKILNDKIWGALLIDAHVPKEKYEHFCEMPPFYCNAAISINDVSEYSKARMKNIENRTERKLVAVMSVKYKLMKVDDLKWLLKHEIEITAIHYYIKAERGKIYKEFVEWGANERRLGDSSNENKILADNAKNILNSSFGQSIMNKSKHTQSKFVNIDEYNKMKYDTSIVETEQFINPEDMNDIVYEMTAKKKTHKQDLPIQLGWSILESAKMRMLEFFYDCVDKFLDRSDYQLMGGDTDSCYMAITKESFDELVKPELKEEYYKEKHKWFPRTTDCLCPECKIDVKLKEHAKYDSRTTGLFKIEKEADGMVYLSSKCYRLLNPREGGKEAKRNVCNKGAQLERNAHRLTFETYKDVLFKDEEKYGDNVSIRYKNKTMQICSVTKRILSNMYVKRLVDDNGIHTYPLMKEHVYPIIQ